MIEHILFDLDGTLADTADDLANALNAIRLQHELTALPKEVIRPTVSLGGNAMIKLAFGLEEGESGFETIRDDFLNYYRANIAQETRLFDGMEELLLSLENENKPWGIVTNKSSWLTGPLVEAMSLDKRAACIISGDTLQQKKPHPAPILHACKLMQSNPATTIYIGDAQRDIEAGRRAGTKTLIALYGYIDDDDDPYTWCADGMVSSAFEIYEKLSEFCN
ncbi:MAG: phosphoglycolate phosphatase, bacterial [marine bacterium B5-7]|nr:MAG: phosphoglycolate phosphatase, bacterial [marine bacterium B5-7]